MNVSVVQVNKLRLSLRAFFYLPYLLIKIRCYNIYLINKVMASAKYINIDFPFKNSVDGYFLEMNSDPNAAIKADLMHLILTRKGQRLYNPEFGTDLLRFIFEPNDELTLSNIKSEIKSVVKKYLPTLTVNDITVTQSDESEYAAVLFMNYTVTDGIFQTTDTITINI